MANTNPIKSSETVTLSGGPALVVTLADGWRLTYRPGWDRRILDLSDGKVQCRSERAAEELAREARADGCAEARAVGCALVFWGRPL